jgi:hypothetical protein
VKEVTLRVIPEVVRRNPLDFTVFIHSSNQLILAGLAKFGKTVYYCVLFQTEPVVIRADQQLFLFGS